MRGGDQSLICAIRGPITLITVGALFALNNFTPYGFHQTWPVILIVWPPLLVTRVLAPVPPLSATVAPEGELETMKVLVPVPALTVRFSTVP